MNRRSFLLLLFSFLAATILTACGKGFKLSITVSPDNAGSVDLDPGGGVYDPGTRVTLTPKPGTVYRFERWVSASSAEVDQDNIIVMDRSKQLSAIFRMIGPPPVIKSHEYIANDLMEVTPLVYRGKLTLVECWRVPPDLPDAYQIVVRDIEKGRVLSCLAQGYGLASAIVHNDTFFIFASRYDHSTSIDKVYNVWHDVSLFESSDLTHWSSSVVLHQDLEEEIFNTSVCETNDGFFMAYERKDPQHLHSNIRFARSTDLHVWTKVPDAWYGMDRYAACPCLLWNSGYFYMLYLEELNNPRAYHTYLTRSRNLINWEPSPYNPILAPENGEGISTSDVDLAELDGTVYIYYAVGDQQTYTKLKRAIFKGPLNDFLESCYAPRR
jgi:hypothetical protein